MRKSSSVAFRVLVVDNDTDLLIAADEQCAELDGVEVEVAASVDEAKEKIATSYFHLALVDLKLHANFDSGIEVLQMLRENSPSCERHAMTRLAATDPNGMLRVVSPFDPLVGGILNKAGLVARKSADIAHLVEPRAASLRATDLEFMHLDPVVSALAESRRVYAPLQRSESAITVEVLTVLQRLFGGRVPGLNGGRPMIEARVAPQGLSGAVAFSVVPVISKRPRRFGARCFVKIGPRRAIELEVARFRDRVQLNVPLKFRVDLLGAEFGDVIGAVAYSFAGGSSADIRSLDEVANGEGLDSDRVIGVLNSLFDRKESNWYGFAGPDRPIGDYFQDELHSDFLARLPILRNTCKKIAQKHGAQFDPEAGLLTKAATRLSVPNERLYGAGFLARKQPTRLMHGDLHGGNILLDEDERVFLIDFAHAGFAPRAIDAAVLHGSVRLWDSSQLTDESLWNSLESIVQKETALAQTWMAPRPRGSKPVTGWERTAARIDQGVRDNFHGITPEEVLWVCLLQAARLSTLHVGEAARLRLLAWFTGVQRALKA